jgi:hypothetical protein
MTTRTTTARWVAAALLIAACGGTAGDSTTSTTAPTATTTVSTAVTTAPTTTIAPATTVAPTTTMATTSTAAPTTTVVYAVGAPELVPPEALAGSDGAAGSGCAPGAGSLPAGIWFGFLVERDGSTVGFDLACFYFGDIAWEKAAEEGQTAENDYWIVNDNPTLRDVPVAAQATIWTITGDATQGLQPLDFASWTGAESTYTSCPGTACVMWLYVNAGEATEIAEQFLP